MSLLAPPSSLIEEELLRLFDSDALRRAPSHMRLLRYLVDKRVAGDEAALRETSIALEVFHRDPATYDPQTDPIVRVTVGRLRDRLNAHYAHYDVPPKLRIVLPKGRYAPDFVAEARDAPMRHGLAVLHTRNTTGDPNCEPFCDAFAQRLADDLARAGLPRIVALGSGSDGARDDALLRSARRLDVGWLVESVLAREADDEMRLSVRLICAPDGGVRWIETGVASDAGRYTLADRLTHAVVLRISATLAHGQATAQHPLAASPLSVPQRTALDTARLLLLRRDLGATDEAVALAESVVTECPSAAAAWSALAAALYSRLTFMDRDIGAMARRVKECADRALSLDPDDAIALRSKANIVGKCDYDVAAAEDLYRRALRSAPHYTSARLNYAEILWLQGRFDEALAEMNLALIYDPLSPSVRLGRAICLGLARRFDEARAEWNVCRATGEVSVWLLTESGLNELAAGDSETAAMLLDDAAARHPELPAALWCRSYAAWARGDEAAAREHAGTCLHRFPHYSRTERASLAALMRDRESVLEHLAAAYAQRDMQFLYASIAPQYEWLANDPDFTAILKAAGCAGWRGRPSLAS
ncbi:MAG: tetratricopeptide repeat protein [Pseudomonadota bacterium]|nr:tetratricopeptide repeat protein [Pseudomonadota bacterium]